MGTQTCAHFQVEFLEARQHLRHDTFWARVERGEGPHPSDGKMVPMDTIRKFVRRLRGTFFENGELRSFTDAFLMQQVPWCRVRSTTTAEAERSGLRWLPHC